MTTPKPFDRLRDLEATIPEPPENQAALVQWFRELPELVSAERAEIISLEWPIGWNSHIRAMAGMLRGENINRRERLIKLFEVSDGIDPDTTTECMPVYVCQIKTKFGGLRFYTQPYLSWVEYQEFIAGHLCGVCGERVSDHDLNLRGGMALPKCNTTECQEADTWLR